MDWQLLLALGVATLSASIILQRILLHKDKADPIAYAIFFNGIVAVVILGTLLILGKFIMPDIGKLWLPMLLTCILFGLGHIVYAKTLQRIEASIFSMLFATQAIWVMGMGGIIFSESIGPWQLVGVVLIFVSVGLLIERKGEVKFDRTILLGLLAGLLFGLATTALVYTSRQADPASWTGLSFVGPALVILLLRPQAVKKMKPLLKREVFGKLLLLSILYAASAVSMTIAYTIGQANIIAPLSQTSIILTIILAIIFLGERQRLWHKLLAAVICFIGVILVV